MNRDKIKADFDTADMFSLAKKIKDQDLRLYEITQI
jgi:hypothetical protein